MHVREILDIKNVGEQVFRTYIVPDLYSVVLKGFDETIFFKSRELDFDSMSVISLFRKTNNVVTKTLLPPQIRPQPVATTGRPLIAN